MISEISSDQCIFPFCGLFHSSTSIDLICRPVMDSSHNINGLKTYEPSSISRLPEREEKRLSFNLVFFSF